MTAARRKSDRARRDIRLRVRAGIAAVMETAERVNRGLVAK